MADRIVEERVVDGGGSGALAVVAIFIGIVALLAVLYFMGAFGGFLDQKKDVNIDVNVQKPSAILLLER